MPNHEKLQDIDAGDQITASYLKKTTRAINENSRAIRAPREVLQVAEDLQNSGVGTSLSDENFTCTVVESDIISTDDAGDDTTLKRVDTFSCTENTTGRKMNFSLTYPA